MVCAVQAAQSRLFSISAALDAERAEAAVLAVELDAERQRSSGTSRAAARAEEHMRTSAASAVLLRDQLKQVLGCSSYIIHSGHKYAIEEMESRLWFGESSMCMMSCHSCGTAAVLRMRHCK